MKDILLGKPESKIEFKPKVFECMRSKMELCSLDGRLDKPFWAQTRFSEEFEDILWNKNSKKPYKAALLSGDGKEPKAHKAANRICHTG